MMRIWYCGRCRRKAVIVVDNFCRRCWRRLRGDARPSRQRRKRLLSDITGRHGFLTDVQAANLTQDMMEATVLFAQAVPVKMDYPAATAWRRSCSLA